MYYYEFALEVKEKLIPLLKRFNASVSPYNLSDDEAGVRVVADGLVLDYTISWDDPNFYIFDQKTNEIIFAQDGVYSADDIAVWFHHYFHATERNLKQ